MKLTDAILIKSIKSNLDPDSMLGIMIAAALATHYSDTEIIDHIVSASADSHDQLGNVLGPDLTRILLVRPKGGFPQLNNFVVVKPAAFATEYVQTPDLAEIMGGPPAQVTKLYEDGPMNNWSYDLDFDGRVYSRVAIRLLQKLRQIGATVTLKSAKELTKIYPDDTEKVQTIASKSAVVNNFYGSYGSLFYNLRIDTTDWKGIKETALF